MIAVPHYISPKDYLDIERDTPIRHEYRRGLVYAGDASGQLCQCSFCPPIQRAIAFLLGKDDRFRSFSPSFPLS